MSERNQHRNLLNIFSLSSSNTKSFLQMQPSSSLTGTTTFSNLHTDLIETHIISRLDGPSLASAASASPFLHELCTQEQFWAKICSDMWPSVTDSHVSDVVSTFSGGHRSLFSDSFPLLHHCHGYGYGCSSTNRLETAEIISAVDIKYKKDLLLSKVIVTETVTDTFAHTPLWVEVLDPKESVSTPIKFEGDEATFLAHLEQYMTLSWILIDKTRKRSANVSSLRPVSVRRHWLTGDVQLRYTTNLSRGDTQHVQLRIEVVCAGIEAEELQIREVNLHVEDMNNKLLSGRDSLVILQDAMEFGERKRRDRGEKERYEEYSRTKRERRVTRMRREKRMDLLSNFIRIFFFLSLVLCVIWENFVNPK